MHADAYFNLKKFLNFVLPTCNLTIILEALQAQASKLNFKGTNKLRSESSFDIKIRESVKYGFGHTGTVHQNDGGISVALPDSLTSLFSAVQ